MAADAVEAVAPPAHPASIETDPAMPNSPWRLEHLDAYNAARSWHSQGAHIIDTTGPTPPSRETRRRHVEHT